MNTAVRRSGTHCVQYGSERISYSLDFSDRKRMAITVEPDGSVLAIAPLGATTEQVAEIIRRRAGWIVRQRDRFELYGPVMPPKSFTNGETQRYLGRQYRLRIRKGDIPSVKLVGRFFEIEANNHRNPLEIGSLLEQWLRARASDVFARQMQACLDHPSLRKLAEPPTRIRKMSHRWGSCTKQGTIVLNLLLVQASPRCIAYVITHELCHLIHYAHDSAFYRLLTRIMPDWQARKQRLDEYLT